MAIFQVRLAERNLDYDYMYRVGDSVTVSINGTVTYDVLCDQSDNQGNLFINNEASGLPVLGSLYTEGGVTYNSVRYTKAKVSRDGKRAGRYCWKVIYTVESPKPSRQVIDMTIVDISTDVEMKEIVAFYDLDGVWNVNSARDFFSDPLMYKYGLHNIRFTRYEATNPLVRGYNFSNKVNSASMWGYCDTGTLYLKPVSSTLETAPEKYGFWKVNYNFQYNPLGWNVVKVDSGLTKIEGGRKMIILNDDGAPIDKPVFLNGLGGVLPSGGTPVNKTFRMIESADFSSLNLPNPYIISAS